MSWLPSTVPRTTFVLAGFVLCRMSLYMLTHVIEADDSIGVVIPSCILVDIHGVYK